MLLRVKGVLVAPSSQRILPLVFRYPSRHPGGMTSRRWYHDLRERESMFGRLLNSWGPNNSSLPNGLFGSIIKPTCFVFLACSATIYLCDTLDKRKQQQQRSNFFRHTQQRRQQQSFFEEYGPLISLFGLNGLVFLMWKISPRYPKLYWFLYQNFVSHTNSSKLAPFLLSSFSHQTPIHLFMNMLGFFFFASPVHQALGIYHFLSLCICSSLTSAYFSHIFRLVTWRYGSSLGASGINLAFLGAASVFFPNDSLQLLFLPFISIPMGVAAPVWAVLESIGLFFKNSTFDHAAHLGGLLTGYVYAQWIKQRKNRRYPTKRTSR